MRGCADCGGATRSDRAEESSESDSAAPLHRIHSVRRVSGTEQGAYLSRCAHVYLGIATSGGSSWFVQLLNAVASVYVTVANGASEWKPCRVSSAHFAQRVERKAKICSGTCVRTALRVMWCVWAARPPEVLERRGAHHLRNATQEEILTSKHVAAATLISLKKKTRREAFRPLCETLSLSLSLGTSDVSRRSAGHGDVTRLGEEHLTAALRRPMARFGRPVPARWRLYPF